MGWILLAAALAGELDGEVALDTFVSTSRNEGPGAGPSESFTSAELGTRVRLRVGELDDRLELRLDYRGRQPFAGNIRNDALHLVYRAEVTFALVEDRLMVGLGRFLAPTPVFLPLDGANVILRLDHLEIGAFGGRRAISTSRKNLAPGDLLPGAGAFIRYHRMSVDLDATVAWSEDLVAVAASGEAIEEPVGGLSAVLRGSGRPTDSVAFGGQVSAIQQATYAIGPTWTEATIEARALGLFNALGWATARPTDWLRVDLDAIHQRVQAWSVGTVEGGSLVEDLQEPMFSDARVRVALGPPKIGWLRPSLRYRIRPDRRELRAGVQLDVNDLGLPGLYMTTSGFVDDISGESQKDDVGSRDRAYGSAAVGYRRGGFDGQLGASYVDRAATPVSGRRVDPGDPGAPSRSEDLQPFTLAADPILAARGFYSGRRWYVGGDLEKSINDAEFRVMVQIGALAEVGW